VSREILSDHYTFESLDDGITFGRARADGTALSNTAVIDLGATTLAFDTSLTLRSARDIQTAAISLTGRPVSVVVNSHWHLDHMLGNQLFAERPIYATRRTIEIVLEKRRENERELSREKLEEDIRALEETRDSATSDASRTYLEGIVRINRAVLAEALELRYTPPTTAFESELKLPGRLDATLLSFGSGHTDSDAVLFLRKSRILCAGDLLVADNHPNLRSGDPEHWLVVLDRIEALRPERIVTGHGPLGRPETIGEIRDYLQTVLRLARESGEPEIPSRFRSWGESGQFEENLAFVRSRPAVGRE
jgi:cyclase